MAEPKNNRGNSKQDYQTPTNFMGAVVERFGEMQFDLAATKENAKALNYYTEEDDALIQDWTQLKGNLWLNPPFAKIAPWAKKCKNSLGGGRTIFLLTPAAVGSNWYLENIHYKQNVCVLALNPRLSFDGKNPFPKDCMLSIFSNTAYIFDFIFDVWKWV